MNHFNKFLSVLLLAICSLAASAQNYTWTQEPSLSVPLVSPASFTIGTHVYVVGGIKAFGAGVSYPAHMNYAVWDYNTVTNTWAQKANFPGTTVYGGSGLTIGTYGYIVTGWDSTGSGSGPNATWQYDPTSDTWAQKANFPGSVRYTTGKFAAAGKGYITCGFSPYQNDMYAYDPTTDSWSQKTAFPGAARQALPAFVINDVAYVGMGATSDGQGSYFIESDFYKYEPTTDTWTRLGNFPGDAVCNSFSFALNGEGWVLNGTSQNSVYYNAANDATRKVWKYVPATDTWTLWGLYPATGTFNGSSDATTDAGYIGFGANNYGTFLPLSDFYRLGPGTAPYSCNVTLNSYSISNAVYNFQASGNFSPSAQLTWNFGDGTTGTGTSVIHNYTAAGHYTITVNVSDTATSCTNSATDTVNVSGISNCSATINQTRYGSLYTLSTSMNGGTGPYTYQWATASDSTYSSTSPNPLVSVPVNTPTTYCVSVTDATGCVATACTTISDSQFVYTPCQIFVAVYPDPNIPGSYYAVLYTTGAANLTYLWDFGDGSTSTLEFPNHVYTTPGQYTVCLTVSDGAGCSFTFCDSSFYAYKYGGGPMQRFSVSQQVTLGIKDGGNTAVSLYPNPTNSIINIEAAGQKVTAATVYNVNGQKVMDVENPSQNSLNVSQLSDGIYMVEIKTRDASTKVKFAKLSK